MCMEDGNDSLLFFSVEKYLALKYSCTGGKKIVSESKGRQILNVKVLKRGFWVEEEDFSGNSDKSFRF